ncbi:spermidine synthase [Pseudoalteromonas sp.]|jgi:spermidine synthase|uniref:spermidine synthase n=1 Tax=Pseudoalteromonas sp. TaxID=53249 RepID=UPI003568E5DC
MLFNMNKFINPTTGVISRHFIEYSQQAGQLLYWHNHKGARIQVRQYQQLRWLLINDTLQSVVLQHQPEQLLLPHLQCLAQHWQAHTAPIKVLELGLGGGAIRNYLVQRYPEAEITSVEINSAIISCYTTFFAHDRQQPLICNSAQQVLNSAHAIDWIVLDLFSQVDAPRFLFEQAFYEKIHAALNNNGTLFINFLAQHESQLKQLQQLLLQVFGYKISPQKIAGYMNHIVMITKQAPKQLN